MGNNMANGLIIDAKELTKGAKAFEQLAKQFPDRISDVLNANADAIVLKAKRNAPADRGQLGPKIEPHKEKLLEKHITSHAPYSAYVEFGTGVYAAQYVGSLPANYQAFAAQFKKGRGFPPIELIKDWIKRKGIVGKGKSKKADQEANQLAYVIARAIFKKGIHPHPFLIPALIDQQPKIIKDIANLIDRMKV